MYAIVYSEGLVNTPYANTYILMHVQIRYLMNTQLMVLQLRPVYNGHISHIDNSTKNGKLHTSIEVGRRNMGSKTSIHKIYTEYYFQF